MFVMKEVEGFSVEEIGEMLGINVNTVKVRLFRARAKLVQIYRRRMQGGAPKVTQGRWNGLTQMKRCGGGDQ